MKAKVCILAITTLLIVGCNAKLIKYPDSADPCMMLNMDANFTLSAINGGFKTDASIDESAIGTGLCADSGSTASVDLIFSSELKGTLGLTFLKGADSTVTMEVTFNFNPDSMFQNKDTTPRTATDVGSTKLSKDTASYTCSAEQDIPFLPVNGTVDSYQFKMVISDVQIQAFNFNGSFAPAEDCTGLAGSTELPGPTTEPPAQPTTQPPKPDNDTTTEPPAPQTTQSAPPNNDTSTEPPAPPTTPPPTKPSNNDTTTEPAPPNNSTTVEPTAPPTTQATTTMPPGPPTPKPGDPGTNTYQVKDTNGTCLLFKAGIEFVVPYINKDGKNATQTIGVPSGNMTEASGDCAASNTTQTLTLTFYEKTWDLMMQFTLDGEDYYLSEVDLTADLTAELIKDIKTPGKVSVKGMFEKGQFSASKDGSYKCNDNSKVTLKNNFEMDTYNLQYAAFQKNTTEFSDNGVQECSSDTETNSVVPIAVGAALAGLVVIVLIAYLIGRKRSRQSGYEQV